MATIQERFEEFNQFNPAVRNAMFSLALQAVRQGKKIGFKMIAEVVRWQFYMNTKDRNSLYKINNNYVARYAALFKKEYPEYSNLIETRKIKTI